MARKKKKENKVQLLIQLNGVICVMIALVVNNGFYIDFRRYQGLYVILAIYFVISSISMRLFFYYRVRNRYLKSGIQDVDKMGGVEFETFLKYHFQKLGYVAETTSVTGDYGADLILKKDHEKLIVQAKRYQEKVGIKAIQEVVAAVGHYKADKGYVITNSFFTKSAMNLAASNHIELWDREKLITIMTKENLQENIQMIKKEAKRKVEANICPWCGKNLIKRNGKHGAFMGCSRYPKCKYTVSLNNDKVE